MILSVHDRPTLTLLEKKMVFHHVNKGGILAFPTDTVYGIGTKAGIDLSVRRMVQLKNRDRCKPFILLGSSISQFLPYVAFPSLLEHPLLQKHWPGPLTAVLPFQKSSGLFIGAENPETIGVRIPNHSLLLDLLSFLGFPLLTTSANPSGSFPLNKGEAIQEWFISATSEKAFILDTGSGDSIPSTVVRLTDGEQVEILREGKLTKETIYQS
jgi:L-threonylcarbamoyladenylate synthase